MSDGGQKVEEEFMIQISDDLYKKLEETAKEYETTVELIVNAILRELLEAKTPEELMEIARDG